MRRRSAFTTAALTVLALFALACAIPELPGAEPGESPSPELTSEPAPTSQAPGPDATGDSLERPGRFNYRNMDEYVALVVGMIEPWLSDTWPTMPMPEVMYVRDFQSGYEGCTDADGEVARYSGESYEYCAPDQTIYLGQSLLWLFFQETGDAGPAMGIAHEFGHHIQDWLGVDPPYTAAESVDYENQADCIAGAWTGYTRDQGWLEVEDDLEDIDLLFPLIASAESEDRDHGTEEEREEAFFDGYERGIRACGLPRL